jgi:hypothetical protein
MLGFGAYADSSRLINDEIRQYKGIKSQAEGLNKELQVQAGQAKTLGDLKNIGEEFGLKTTKDLLKNMVLVFIKLKYLMLIPPFKI